MKNMKLRLPAIRIIHGEAFIREYMEWSATLHHSKHIKILTAQHHQNLFFANTATNQWYSITLHALLVSLNVETIFIGHRVAVSSVPGYYGIPRWNQGRGQRPFRRILVIQYQSFHWGLNHSVVLELKFLL